jgi:type II secretory pathway pseudopilin PulG
MNIKASASQAIRRGTRAFTLVEVLISVGILAFMMMALFSAFAFGFASIATVREDLRATQVLMQKVEAVRLCRWDQLTNCPKTFRESYDPNPATNASSGVAYGGTLATTDAAAFLPSAYRDKVHLVTVTITWTNNTGRNKIVHSRQLQTLAAYNGIQNYIYGITVK